VGTHFSTSELLKWSFKNITCANSAVTQHECCLRDSWGDLKWKHFFEMLDKFFFYKGGLGGEELSSLPLVRSEGPWFELLKGQMFLNIWISRKSFFLIRRNRSRTQKIDCFMKSYDRFFKYLLHKGHTDVNGKERLSKH